MLHTTKLHACARSYRCWTTRLLPLMRQRDPLTSKLAVIAKVARIESSRLANRQFCYFIQQYREISLLFRKKKISQFSEQKKKKLLILKIASCVIFEIGFIIFLSHIAHRHTHDVSKQFILSKDKRRDDETSMSRKREGSYGLMSSWRTISLLCVKL